MKAARAGCVLPSAAVRAEAAAWIARLHGPSRTREVEEGLRRWLAEAPEHAAAFELLTDVWEKAARLDRRAEPIPSRRANRPVSFMRTALATIVVALAAAGTLPHSHSDRVSSGIGQLRSVTLADGTHVRLDADTELLVRYGPRTRHVVLVRGQAYFEVAHRADWPFLVTSAGHAVRDLGTRFNVRREGDLLAVTLVQGEVEVSSVRPSGARPLDLAIGERVTFAGKGAAKIDWPALARVLAWERGEVPLENVTLADAAARLNHYSRQRIVVEPPVAAIRVSGIVQAGDSSSFAAAVAKTYGLRVLHPAADRIVLAPSR